MYERFKKEFLSQISQQVSQEQLQFIQLTLDKVASAYTFSDGRMLPDVYGNSNMELLQTYLVCRKLEGYSDKTLVNYHSCLKNLFSEIRKPVENITANDIRVYLYRYKESRKISDRSLDKVRQHITAFWNWLRQEEYIGKDIARQLKPIKHEVKPRIALTQVQLEYVRRACTSSREKAVVEFLYSTGCRASELANCKITDVDFLNGTVHLLGKGNKHRPSYINAKCHIALTTYLKERKDDSEWLFVGRGAKHIDYRTVELWVRNISERAYDDIHVKITPHIFRHTTATTALAAGMEVPDIQKLLGHANVSTTMIYADVRQAHVQESHTRCVV